MTTNYYLRNLTPKIVEKDGGRLSGADRITSSSGQAMNLTGIKYIDENGQGKTYTGPFDDIDPLQTEYGTIEIYNIIGEGTGLIRFEFQYTLDDRNSNDKVRHLDEGQIKPELFTFTVEPVDGVGSIDPKDLVINVIGSNDAPIIEDEQMKDYIAGKDVYDEDGNFVSAGIEDDDHLDEVEGNPNAVNVLENRDGMEIKGKVIAGDENADDGDQFPDSYSYSFGKDPNVGGDDPYAVFYSSREFVENGVSFIEITNGYGTIKLNTETGEWTFTGDPGSSVYTSLREGDDPAPFQVSFVVTDSFHGEAGHDAKDTMDEITIDFEITGVNYGYDLNAVHEYAPSDILAWIERDGGKADPDTIVGDAKISELEAYGDWVQSDSLEDLIITQPLDTFGFDSSKDFWILTKDAGNGEHYQVIIDEDGRSFYTGDKDLGTNEEIIPVEFNAKVTGHNKDGEEVVRQVDSTIITGSDTDNLEKPMGDFISDGSIQEESLVDYAAYTGKNGEVSNEQGSNGYNTNRDHTVIDHDIGATNGGRTYVEFNGFQDIELDGNIYADEKGSYLNVTVDTPNRGDKNRDDDSAYYENKVTIGDITVEEGAAGSDIKIVTGSKDYNYKSKSDITTGEWEFGGTVNNVDIIGRGDGISASSSCGMSGNTADYDIGKMTFNGESDSHVNISAYQGDYTGKTSSSWWGNSSNKTAYLPVNRGYVDGIVAAADAVVDYNLTGILGSSDRAVGTRGYENNFWDFENVTAKEDAVLNLQASLINIGDINNSVNCSSKPYNTIRLDSLNAQDDSEVNLVMAGVSVGNITSDYSTYFQGSMGANIDNINSSEYATLNIDFAYDATGDFMATGSRAIKSINTQAQGMFFNFNDLAGDNNINIYGVNGGDSKNLLVQDTRLIAIGYTSTRDEGSTLAKASRYYDMDDDGMVVTGDLNMNIYGVSGGTATNLQKMSYADRIDGEQANIHVKLGHVDLTEMTGGDGIQVYGIADKVVDSRVEEQTGQAVYVSIEGSLKTDSYEDFEYYGIAREMSGTVSAYYSKFELDAAKAEGGLTAYGYAEAYTGGKFTDTGTVEIKTGSGDDLIFTMFDFKDATVDFTYVDNYSRKTVDAGAGDDRVVAGLGTRGSTKYDGGEGDDVLVLVGSLSDYAGLEGKGQNISNFTSNGEIYGAKHTFSAYDFETIEFTDSADILALDAGVWTVA